METNVLDERLAFRARLRERPLVDDRAVRALRRDAARRATSGWRAIGRAARAAWPTAAARRRRVRTGRATAPEALIVAARQEYGWGAKKLLQVLRTRHPTRAVAGAQHRQRDPRAPRPAAEESAPTPTWTHPGAAPLHTERPNQVWPADFKGPVQDRRRPLLLSADGDRSLQPRACWSATACAR